MTETLTPTDRTTTGSARTPHVLVVIGHPLADTLNHALAGAYIEAARTRAEVRVHDLHEIRLDHPDARDQLRTRGTGDLEPHVQVLLDDLLWADHVTVFFPQWWGTYPAVLKAYLDRVVLSGAAFRYKPGPLPERLLTGRTARILMTADGPGFWNRLVYRNAAETSLAKAVFAYCGVKVRGITRFMKVRYSTPAQRERWIAVAASLGARDAAARVRA